MFVSFSKPNKSIVSYVSNGNPLIQWLDCSLEVVKLHNLNRSLILTLASFQRDRNFKLGEVGRVITIHSYEFLKTNKSVLHLGKMAMKNDKGPYEMKVVQYTDMMRFLTYYVPITTCLPDIK